MHELLNNSMHFARCQERANGRAFPGGFRVWWRPDLIGGGLDNTHLMRLAGRFSRRIHGYAKANGIPVVHCSSRRHGFRNYRLRRPLVAFQKRFRLLELPQPEIRPEFDHHTSNAGMLQSEISHLERFLGFHRLSTRRPRVLLRQSGGLKQKTPGPMRASLLQLIFSPVAFEFSS
jgi:hypothetical protein